MTDRGKPPIVLGISGGRLNSNNDALCKQALLSARQNGAEIRFIRLSDLHISDCRGCFACARPGLEKIGSACVLEDDFDWLRAQMLKADGIIFSLPVFRLGAPASFIRLIERFGIRDDIGKYLLRECTDEAAPMLKYRPVAYMGTGGTDLTPRFDSDCRLFSTVTGWMASDVVTFNFTRSVFSQKDYLNRASALGEKLMADIQNGEILPDEKDGICPFCHGDSFRLSASGTEAECCSCGMHGKFKIENNVPVFVPEDKREYCFAIREGKIKHTLDVAENNRLRSEMEADPDWKETKRYYQNLEINTLKP